MEKGPYGFNLAQSCMTCLDRSEGFFCELDGKSLETFDRVSFMTSFPTGAVLFAEGEQPRGIYMLCHGRAKLSITSPEGKTLVTRLAQSGEVLGLSSVLSGEHHRATVETLEPCQVKFMRTEDFLKFVNEFGDACFRSSQQLSHECHAMSDQLRSVGLAHTAQQKIVQLFLGWAKETGRVTGKETRVKMTMTHQQIAEIIGTSRETVTRTLADLKRRGLITTKGSTLIIPDSGALERAAA